MFPRIRAILRSIFSTPGHLIRAWCTAKARRLGLPTTAYMDPNGVAWRETPDWQDAASPDKGQHDWAKRAMRIFLHRMVNDLPPGPGVLSAQVAYEIGIGTRPETVSVLSPVGIGLAEACRRLGFARLARSANPAISEDQLREVFLRHERDVVEEAHRRFRVNTKTADSWDDQRMGRPFVFESVEETIALLGLGPYFCVSEDPSPLDPFSPNCSAADYTEFTSRRNA